MIAAITYDPLRQNKYQWINLATELCMFYGKEREDGHCLYAEHSLQAGFRSLLYQAAI